MMARWVCIIRDVAMTFESGLALAGTLFILAIVPGPGVMAVTGCALGRGTAAALAMTAGVVIGDLVYLSFAVFGLAVLAHVLGDLFVVVRFAGAGYLIWLGIKLWRSSGVVAPEADTPAQSKGRGLWRPAATGLAVTLGNPKAIAFYLGLLPTFIDLTSVSGQDFAWLVAITVAVIGGSVGAYAVAAGRARDALRKTERVRALNRTAGTIMIGTGFVLAARS